MINFKKYTIVISVLSVLIPIHCGRKPSSALIDWGTKESKHEGFPLFLRKPNYQDIFQFQDRFPRLFTVTQILAKVKPNGLPEAEYNQSLSAFDEEIINLLNDTEGLFVLVETFAGKRHYYFYTDSKLNLNGKISNLKKRYPNYAIQTTEENDEKWHFLRNYPERLY